MCTHKPIHTQNPFNNTKQVREFGASLMIYNELKDFGYFKLQLKLFHSSKTWRNTHMKTGNLILHK